MISTISARSLVLGAVFFTLSLSPSFATPPEGPDDPGNDISDVATPTSAADGGNGSNGGGEQDDGYDGGNGGNINVVSTGSGDDLGFTSAGGDGGNGANFCDNECGDPQEAGNGGDAGDGGSVEITLIEGTVQGRLQASSQGGAGGMPGDGSNVTGAVGNGGDVTITVATGGTVLGDVLAQSLGGTLNGMQANAHGGDVTVTISGTVTGKVETRTHGDQGTAGAIKVVIDGGVVTGEISAGNDFNSSLTFKFDVADRTEFNAATAALTGPGAEGQVTINNHVYTWTGFATLVDLLRYVGPDDKVVVSVKETTSSETTNVGDAANTPSPAQPKPPAPAQQPMLVGDIPLVVGKPEMAKCSGNSEIRTVRLDDGALVVIHHTGGADTLIGKLADGEFRRASDAPDWTVQVGDQGKSVAVSDSTGNALSNCSFS